MLTITKAFTFDCAHVLRNYDGKCNNLHGHTFRLEVTIRPSEYLPQAPENMIMDFGDLKKIVKETIIDELDHKFINDVVKADNCTSEFLVQYIVDKLYPLFKDSLVSIKLYETQDSWCEWRAKYVY